MKINKRLQFLTKRIFLGSSVRSAARPLLSVWGEHHFLEFLEGEISVFLLRKCSLNFQFNCRAKRIDVSTRAVCHSTATLFWIQPANLAATSNAMRAFFAIDRSQEFWPPLELLSSITEYNINIGLSLYSYNVRGSCGFDSWSSVTNYWHMFFLGML